MDEVFDLDDGIRRILGPAERSELASDCPRTEQLEAQTPAVAHGQADEHAEDELAHAGQREDVHEPAGEVLGAGDGARDDVADDERQHHHGGDQQAAEYSPTAPGGGAEDAMEHREAQVEERLARQRPGHQVDVVIQVLPGQPGLHEQALVASIVSVACPPSAATSAAPIPNVSRWVGSIRATRRR